MVLSFHIQKSGALQNGEVVKIIRGEIVGPLKRFVADQNISRSAPYPALVMTDPFLNASEVDICKKQTLQLEFKSGMKADMKAGKGPSKKYVYSISSIFRPPPPCRVSFVFEGPPAPERTYFYFIDPP